MYLRVLALHDAWELLDLRVRNRAFFGRFEPRRPDGFFTLESQRDLIAGDAQRRAADVGYAFGIFLRKSDELVGWVSLSNISRGGWQNATLGYAVDEGHNRRGIATEAVRLVVGFAFEHGGLHRVQAAIMPRNARSIRVVEKAGFRFEGVAERYLQIDGVWEDHSIYAVTKEEWSRRLP
jgi:ribosomal-protein-alanine N-acetyltransferase